MNVLLQKVAGRISVALGEQVKVSLLTRLNQRTIREIRQIEKEAFILGLRYSADEFSRFSQEEDFRAITFKNMQGRIIGFVMGYHNREDERDVYFLDVMALEQGYRKRGAAKALLPAISILRKIGYKSAYLFCDDRDVDGADLVDIYRKLGFVHIGHNEEIWT